MSRAGRPRILSANLIGLASMSLPGAEARRAGAELPGPAITSDLRMILPRVALQDITPGGQAALDRLRTFADRNGP